MFYFQDTPISRDFWKKHTESKFFYYVLCEMHSAEPSNLGIILENKVEVIKKSQ